MTILRIDMNMEEKIGLITILTALEPTPGFCDRILSRIEVARRRQAQIRCAATSASSFMFGMLLVPLFQYAAREFYASGFYDYASLAFSDHSALAGNGQEFFMTLVESLPSVALLALSAVLFALLWSIRRAIQSGRIAFTPLHQNLA